jgi:hypothetical protein
MQTKIAPTAKMAMMIRSPVASLCTSMCRGQESRNPTKASANRSLWPRGIAT